MSHGPLKRKWLSTHATHTFSSCICKLLISHPEGEELRTALCMEIALASPAGNC